MKLTPLDIHHKEFRHSLRGYSEEEVDAFLDEVADEFERLFKENIDLAERLEAVMEKLRGHEQMEKTIHNTLLVAQKSAEDIEANAQKEAELTRRDAELRAKEVIHEALTLKQKTQNEFMRIKQAETEFRQAFRTMLEDYLSGVQEISAPEDVEAMVRETKAVDAIIASIEPVRQEAPEPVAPMEPAAVPTVESAQEILVKEPLEPGSVTSIQLGEMGESDIATEEPEYEEPAEFEIPALDSLGERDDDLDIEEID